MNKRNINLAKFAGFCYGVKRAVDTAIKIKEENPNKNVYVLGELIHNTDVINELNNLGIITLNKIPEKGDGICIIRSHGATPDEYEKIEKAGFSIVDLTCPDVKKVQQKAIELAQEGYTVIIVGKENHPEVRAIKLNAEKYTENVIVASCKEDLFLKEDYLKKIDKIGVVVQTTQMLSTLNNIVDYLKTLSANVQVYNTICKSTSMRQNEAKEIAKNSNLMIVVGSKKSANTTHLAEILNEHTNTLHIENESEVFQYQDLIKESQSIGVTAGASTPDYVINKVIEKIKEEIKL